MWKWYSENSAYLYNTPIRHSELQTKLRALFEKEDESYMGYFTKKGL